MKLRFPWLSRRPSPCRRRDRLRANLNYGYLVAMSMSAGGILLGMVIADYFQGRVIEKLHQTNIQASLLRQFRDASQQAQIQGAQVKLLLHHPGQIRTYKTRLARTNQQINELKTEILDFATASPQYLAAPITELELMTQNYVTALNQQYADILNTLPDDLRQLSEPEQVRIERQLQQIERRLHQSALQNVDWQLDRALNNAERQALQSEIDLETAQGIEKTFIIVSSLLSVALGGVFVWQLSKRLLTPIETLSRTTQAIAQSQDYSLRTPVLTNDEAGRLAQDFNQLIEAIEQQTEILITAKEKAEAADAAKSTFLATMTHELRTPLNAVLGYTQLLLTNPKLDVQTQDILATIQRSGNHLLNLVNDVLHLSRVEADKAVVEQQEFDFHELLQSLEAMFALTAQQQQLQLHWQVAADIPQYLHSDATKLRQILINLVGNALKFTTTGQVTVRVSQQEQQAQSSPHLQLQVQDTGPGIARAELATLFEPFTQTRTGRDLQQGTGLGLALCDKFARLLGGEIRVESSEGVGSTFTVVIPCPALAQAPDRAQAYVPAIAPPHNSVQIAPPTAPLNTDPLKLDPSHPDLSHPDPSHPDSAHSMTPAPASPPLSLANCQQLMGEDWCQQMHHAALAADPQDLERLLAQLPPSHATWAATIQGWIEDYRFDRITDCLAIELDTPNGG
ncbi:MAG: ATP-binding protein [Spirulinaceae cyanobacterium]